MLLARSQASAFRLSGFPRLDLAAAAIRVTPPSARAEMQRVLSIWGANSRCVRVESRQASRYGRHKGG